MGVEAYGTAERTVFAPTRHVGKGYIANTRTEPRCVSVHFSSGGNERGTMWSVHIDGDSFHDLARHMMEANREAAIRAFGLALAGQLPPDQPDIPQ